MFIKNLIRSLTNRYLIGGQYDDKIRIFFKSVLDDIIKKINSKYIKREFTDYMTDIHCKINPDITKDMKMPGIYLISQEYQPDKKEDVTIKIGMGKDVLGRIDEYGTLAYDGVFLYGIGFDILDDKMKEKRATEFEENIHRYFLLYKERIKKNTYTRLWRNITGKYFGEWFKLSIDRFEDYLYNYRPNEKDFGSYVFIIFDKPIRFSKFITPENIQYSTKLYYQGHRLNQYTLIL